MTNFRQKLFRFAFLGIFSLPFFSISLFANTYIYTEMGNTWSSSGAWEGGVVPPTLIPAGDEVIIRGYCDLDMDIRLEAGAILVVAGDATLYCSRNIGVENYGKFVIEGNFIADGMTINNYGDLHCLPTTGNMKLCDRSEATWNNFGSISIGEAVQFEQSSGTFVNAERAILNIDGIYRHTEGVFAQLGTVHGRGHFDNRNSAMPEFVNEGTLSPGNSPGAFHIDNDFRNSRTLDIEIGGDNQGVDQDVVRVGRKAYLGGNLIIRFINGFRPQNGQKFAIITHSGSTGRFDNISVPSGFQVRFMYYNTTEVVIVLEAATILPIDLTDFSAKKQGNSVQLHWSTAVETTSKGVNIQHSTDGKSWQNIGFMKSLGKASDYVFNHNEPKNVNYYRLEQVDFDGKTAFSKTIAAQFDEKKGPLSIFPNPTTDVANFSFETAEKAQLQIVDIAGKIIFQSSATQTGTMTWQTQGVARGMYFAILTADNQRFMEKIFVK
jgi:hypothetical protein